MSSYRCLVIFLSSILLSFPLQFSSPASCLAQPSAKAKVDALYQKYMQLNKQGRYREAIQYAKELVPAGEEAFGKGHPNVAMFMNNLAALYIIRQLHQGRAPLQALAVYLREGPWA